MEKQNLLIQNIPVVLWGEKSSKLFIAVHGNMSNKEDIPISMLAEEAVNKGYQVLSFDLPEHGDRKHQPDICKVQNCVKELVIVMQYARTMSDSIGIFANSMGAYFSLIAYKDEPLSQCLFLSPVVNMETIIDNMMNAFGITTERLEEEGEIQTPIGMTLYWDYYCYVKENPITYWDKQTSILYGANDEICSFDVISSFVGKFGCSLQVLKNAQHYFHTDSQLDFYRKWLGSNLK